MRTTQQKSVTPVMGKVILVAYLAIVACAASIAKVDALLLTRVAHEIGFVLAAK